MALANVVKFTPASSGTGDFVYSSTAVGFRTPVGNLTDGSTYSYRAESADLSEWEIGTGTWTSASSTLARTTVVASSTGSKVSFTAAPSVGIVALAADILQPGNNLSDVGSAATTATNLGLGTGDSPQFTGVNIGHATDTTISRVSAGDIAVEGNTIYRAGGTDVALADGGTGASLTDPNADRIMFWDDSAGVVTWLAPGTGLSISETDLNVTISGSKQADQQVFTSSGTWSKPSGFGAKAVALIQNWGGGGGASRAGATGSLSGGGGGQYSELWILLSSLGSTETVTIGSGGAGRTGSTGNGSAGGNTTFGSWLTAYGGGGGSSGGLGARGGSPMGAGVAGSTGNGVGGSLTSDGTFFLPPLPAWQGGYGKSASSYPALLHADSLMAGAGGGSANSTAGGTSIGGGNGGTAAATAGAGSVPGGGGASSTNTNTDGGSGAAGKCVVTVFDGA